MEPSLLAIEKFSAGELDEILAETEVFWDELRGEQIFITGGSGFIGGWLLETLHHANRRFNLKARATVLTRDPRAFRQSAPHLEAGEVFLLRGDLLDFRMPAGTFSFVIHAAADVAGRSSHESAAAVNSWNSLVSGTQRVLEKASAAGAKKLLFTSSGAVYGSQPPNLPRIAETYQGAPPPAASSSIYGEGKRASEMLCTILGQQLGIECKIARIFTTFGPGQPLSSYFAISNFLADVLESRPPQIKGDGRPIRSYLYVRDLVTWLWTILFRGVPNDPYNVGSETGISIAELAQRVAACGEQSLEAAENVSRVVLSEPAPRYVPDTSKARKELGLLERIGLDEGIQRTLRWHRVQRGIDKAEGSQGCALPLSAYKIT